LKGGLNTYAYVRGNPINYYDPDGRNLAWAGRVGWWFGRYLIVPAINEAVLWATGVSTLGGLIYYAVNDSSEITVWATSESTNHNSSDEDAKKAAAAAAAAAVKECEERCDLEWDRNKVMCDADAAMRGYDPGRYRQCMNEVDKIYIECIQDCNADQDCN
jgi:uncharacterized protein RhaS with RHS repeats